MNKTIKKVLTIALIYLIGIGCVLSLCARAEQVNKKELSNTPIENVDR